jgi:hypothetical protein
LALVVELERKDPIHLHYFTRQLVAVVDQRLQPLVQAVQEQELITPLGMVELLDLELPVKAVTVD